MKTTKTTLLVAVFTILATAVFASGNLKVNMSKTNSKNALVEASNANFNKFVIELKDEFGEMIFSKETEVQADYKKEYNFSRLGDGTYFLEINHGNEYLRKRFELKNGEVEVISQRKVVNPVFIQKGDEVKMSYLNFPHDEMSVYVYDDSDLLHEQKFKTEFAVHKSIDLSELRPGDYRIVFASGFDIFEHDVTVE